jgi:hypothetical protein
LAHKKIISKLGFPEEQRSTNSIASLLEATGMETGDLVEVINALSKIKRKNRQQDSTESDGLKRHYLDKEYVFDTRKVVFIYRSSATKSGRH